MTLADYVQVLRARFKVLLVCVALGVLAASLYNYAATVRYTATATSFVLVTATDPTSPDNFQNSQFAVQRVKSYAELVDGPDVIYPVISALDLDLTPRELREMVTVSSPAETVLLDFEVTDTDAERAAAITNAVADELGQLIEEVETPRDGGEPAVKVTLTRPAEVPADPSAPRTFLNLLLGLVAGLALGFVAALVRHSLDRRIKSADDVRALTGSMPLGTIVRPRRLRDPLVVLDPHSAGVEGYRAVRSALKFAVVDSSLRDVAVSSPGMGEARTTLAANLALSWAQAGARVCLVEADLRRPGVASMLGVDGDGAGLTEVLVGDAELDDVLVPWREGLIQVLPAGSLPPDPAALLGSESMGSLVSALRDRFDLVVYDTPPVGPVTDAVVLGRTVDGVVLVVSAGSTTRDRLASSVELLRSSRVTVLGTVVDSHASSTSPDVYRSRAQRPGTPATVRAAATPAAAPAVEPEEDDAAPRVVDGSPRANGTVRPDAPGKADGSPQDGAAERGLRPRKPPAGRRP